MIEWRNEQEQLHRIDGPARIWTDGSREWYLNGKRHRDDGPAVIWSDGHEEWYVHGQRHRVDGPAVIYLNGLQKWWVNGQELTQFEVWVLAGAKEHV